MATAKKPTRAATKAAPKKTTKKAKTTSSAKTAAAKPKIIRAQTTKKGKEIVVAVPPVKVPRFLDGFLDFVRTQGVVGLAVGLVLGVAAKGVVDALVANVFNPIIGLAGGGGGSLEGRFICLKHAVNTVNGQQVVSCSTKLGYGSVLSQIISFLTVAAVVYFVVKGLKLDKLDKAKA